MGLFEASSIDLFAIANSIKREPSTGVIGVEERIEVEIFEDIACVQRAEVEVESLFARRG